MPAEDLATITLAFHGATLIPLGIALQKFSDRTEMFQKSLAGTGDALARLRRVLASDLEQEVGALLSNTLTVQSTLVLDSTGHEFKQHRVNPIASEAYRNCIHEFTTRQESALTAYYALCAARDRWARWARRVSWSVLLLFGWEAVAFATTGLVAELLGVPIPRELLLTSYVPTVVLFFAFIAAQTLALRQHDIILDVRRNHDPL